MKNNTATQRLLLGLITLIRVEIGRFLQIWPQTLLSPILLIVLYFVIFSQLTNTVSYGDFKISFKQFIIPGLILMSVIFNAYNNVSFSIWNHRFQNSLEELLVSPLPRYIILLGFTIAGIFRGICIGFIITIAATLVVDFSLHDYIACILLSALTACVFSLLGFTVAMRARNFDELIIFPNFILTPLVYLGGVFFATQHLQANWAWLLSLNPMYHLMDAFRQLALGMTSAPSALLVTVMLGLIVALFMINLWILRSDIERI